MTKERFIELVSQEQEPLRRFLQILCRGDAFTADDLAQEALLKAYLSFRKFEGRSKFSTWLLRIAYNCWYDWVKKHGRTEEFVQEKDSSEYNHIPDTSFLPDSRFTHQELYLALEKLSHAERTVTLLFYMEEKSIKEIEQIMEIPSGTIRSHLSRARGHLKEYLNNFSGNRNN